MNYRRRDLESGFESISFELDKDEITSQNVEIGLHGLHGLHDIDIDYKPSFKDQLIKILVTYSIFSSIFIIHLWN